MTRYVCLAVLMTLPVACDAPDDRSATAGTSGVTEPEPCPTEEPEDPPPVGKLLSPTRLLRRIKLTLVGKLPTYEEYEALAEASDDAAKDAIIAQAIEDALSSPDFYQHMVDFGHDYLRTSSYNQSWEGPYFLGGQQATLHRCEAGTTHEGVLSDAPAMCDDGAATTATIEPWWAPGTTVTVFSVLASGVTESGGEDCGRVSSTLYDLSLPDAGCSCGPNLLYCIDFELTSYAAQNNDEEDSQRRQLWDEPARLFAHLAHHDRPLSDLVVGDYTVAPVMLQAFYWKTGRQAASDPARSDASNFWQPSTWSGPTDPLHEPSSPVAWREVEIETLNPTLISDRDYTFDPRTDSGEPIGIPSAGVMTMPGTLGSFARERVRGARWLETFACKTYVPPPAGAEFNPYVRDPATEGVCQHCHVTIDLAATFFKRWDFAGYGELTMMGGIGPWRWDEGNYGQPWVRWNEAFAHDTVMTPVPQSMIDANPDVRFIDFLTPDRELLGVTSDGTIGPLGLGKILLESGEFDTCMVRTLYRRFVGRALDPGAEKRYIDELAAKFVDDDRALRPFVRHLLATEQFRRGL